MRRGKVCRPVHPLGQIRSFIKDGSSMMRLNQDCGMDNEGYRWSDMRDIQSSNMGASIRAGINRWIIMLKQCALLVLKLHTETQFKAEQTCLIV